VILKKGKETIMLRKIIGLVFLLSLFVIGTSAQTSTATLSGSVTDENNAAIAGATVTILNIDTGVKRTVTTNSDGGFVVPLLQPSKYQVTIQQANFSPFEVNDLVLNTNDNRFLNIKLKAGSISEKVTVEASTVEVDTSSAVATTVDQNMVERIPLNGRTIQNLIALTPGAITFTGNNAANVGQISVNGLRTTQNYLTIDGVSANIYVGTSNTGVGQANGLVPGFSQLGTTSNLVSVDALQEFKVQSSSYSPEFGRTPGAQIQLTTRSGSNQYHGNLSEYFRNEKLDANDWFANANKLTRAPLRHNNYGGTFSGPLPTLNFGEGVPMWSSGKNKTFFFFSFEGTRIKLPQTLTNGTVPSLQVRNTINAALRPFLSVFPTATGPDNANGTTAPYIVSYSNPQQQDSYALRIDHNLTSKINFFGRYSYSPQESLSLSPQRSQATRQIGKTKTLTFGVNTAFSTNLANEFRFNWSRNFAQSGSRFYSVGGTTLPDPSLYRFSPLTQRSTINFTVASSLFPTNPGNIGLRKQINVTDTFSWVMKDHLIKFGFDYRQSPSKLQLPDYSFSATFNTLAAVQTATASSVLYTINNPEFTNYEWKSFGAFAQDTWRVTNRLTLDFGLRWDVNPPADVTPARRLVIVDFVNPIRLAPEDAKLYPTIWTAFAPRFGASYMLSNKDGMQTVIRGGYGLYFDAGSGSNGSVSGGYYPFTASKTVTNVVFPFAATVLAPPVISNTIPYPQASFLAQYDSDYVLPRVHQWNLAIEQGLGKNQTLSVTYSGNAGRRFLRGIVLPSITRSYPIPSPDFTATTGFNLVTNGEGRDDISDYNAMQVQFNRRSKNVSAIVNYTWSHSLDTASATTNTTGVNSYRISSRTDRAASAFDRRHIFSSAVTWSLPSISKAMNSILHAVTKDWSLDGIFQYQSGAPMDILYQDASTNNNLSLQFLRPDLVAGQPLWIDFNGPTGKAINPAAFSIPTTFRQGNLPRNFIRTGGFWQPDIALSRTFAFTERIKLRLKSEVFNFVNHPLFAQPNFLLGIKNANGTITTAPTFGQYTTMLGRTTSSEGIALSSIYAPGGPRSIQLSFKLSF
jgi:hypothetical protein